MFVSVSALTETNIYHNVRGMFKTGAVPFLATSALFVLLARSGEGGVDTSVTQVFAEAFRLHWTALIPAVLMLTLAVCRVNVRIALLVSVIAGIAVSVLLQGMPIGRVLWSMLAGYRADGNELLSSLLDGGGIRAMLRIIAVPTLSSSFSGIFAGTGLLDGLKSLAERAAKRITAFGATLLVSIFANVACCNQTLATILTEQICHRMDPDRERFALTLENTSIVIAPLIPWSIAGSAPLLSAGAPIGSSIALSFYLYLIPLWNLLLTLLRARRERRA